MKRLTVLIAVMMVAVATPAAAYCSRNSLSGALESDLYRELDYLMCLHNDQVMQINTLANENIEMRATASEIQDVIARLQVQLADMEDRLQALERQR